MPTVPFPSMQCPNSNSRHDFRYDEHLLLGQLTKPNLYTKTETGQAKRTAKKVHQAKVHQAILTPKCAANARSSILAILTCKNSIPIPFANPHPPQSISPLPAPLQQISLSLYLTTPKSYPLTTIIYPHPPSSSSPPHLQSQYHQSSHSLPVTHPPPPYALPLPISNTLPPPPQTQTQTQPQPQPQPLTLTPHSPPNQQTQHNDALALPCVLM